METRKGIGRLAAALVFALVAFGAPPAGGLLASDARKSHPGLRVENLDVRSLDELMGMPALNAKGDRLGGIAGALLESDEVQYLVVGIGKDGAERLVPVPSPVARITVKRDGIVLDLSQAILAEAPYFTRDLRPDFTDRQWHKRVNDYYRTVAPGHAAGYVLKLKLAPKRGGREPERSRTY